MSSAVIYFSPAGSTKRIGNYVASYLEIIEFDITSYESQSSFDYTKELEYLIFCFPVYSENLPNPLKTIIPKLKSRFIIFIATYGKMGYGNVLYETTILTKSKIIGGAYIPTKHTYKEEAHSEYFQELSKLDSLLDRVKLKLMEEIKFPKLSKNIFANFIPNLRSKFGVKLRRTTNCISCGLCNEVCPQNSIENGLIGGNCMRCLSCYYHCPSGGLKIKYSIFLRLYLKKEKRDEFILY